MYSWPKDETVSKILLSWIIRENTQCTNKKRSIYRVFQLYVQSVLTEYFIPELSLKHMKEFKPTENTNTLFRIKKVNYYKWFKTGCCICKSDFIFTKQNITARLSSTQCKMHCIQVAFEGNNIVILESGISQHFVGIWCRNKYLPFPNVRYKWIPG